MANKSFMVKLLSEDSAESSTRLMFFVGSLWAMAFTTAYAFVNKDATAGSLVALFAGMFGPFGTLKFGQKLAEKPKTVKTDK